MKHALDLFSFDGRVTRKQYLIAGVALAALKYPLDLGVSRAFRQPWGPARYIWLRALPIVDPNASRAYLLALLAVALPFIAVGVSLSARRLRDAGVSPFWSGLFLLPLFHWLFIAALLVAPPRRAVDHGEVGPYRERAEPRDAPPPVPARWLPPSDGGRFLLGVVASTALGLGAFVAAAQLNESLGIGLFVGLPFGMGFLIAFCMQHGREKRLWASTIGYSLLPGALVMLGLMCFGIEGAACVLMSSPIVLGMEALGGLAGAAVATKADAPDGAGVIARALLPAMLTFGVVAAAPAAPLHVVSRSVDVRAEPAVVWRALSDMTPIDEAPSPVFALVAMPLELAGASGDATTPRTWRFTNGDFETEVERARDGEEVALRVTSEPAALRRLVDVERGGVRLERLPDGSTRLHASTELRLRLAPDAYWAPWSDALVGAVEARMLAHVKAVAEGAPRCGAAEMPWWMQDANESCPCTRHRAR
jgi:uncharacterized membrane protein YhaH (DUF805 family)